MVAEGNPAFPQDRFFRRPLELDSYEHRHCRETKEGEDGVSDVMLLQPTIIPLSS